MIPRESIAGIMDASRIEDVIGDFVSLKKRGVNMLGLCPFHNEKTPSFTVSPAKGIYKCFGCGKAGNAVNFVMEHEHYSYPEALRYLAKKYNIELNEEEPTEEEIKQQSEQETFFNIFSFAGKYFFNAVWESEEGKAVGLSYFEERGYTHPVIKRFELGYCSDKQNEFTKHAIKNAYTFEQLKDAGLTAGTNSSSSYDMYRGRVIFPIQNLSGRIIAFGARILTSEKNKPKYINTPETPIYSKSKVLYGLYQARNAIAKNDSCYLVEGYTDVISLHQAGVENVVASSGTSLTAEQIRLIKRYTRNIIILYDGDDAGVKAAMRGVDMILEEDMRVKVVVFPEGEDPDSFSRKNRQAELVKFLNENAKDFIAFKLFQLIDEARKDPVKRVNIVKDFVSTIAKIPDNLTRLSYIKESSEHLDMPEAVLINELNKILRKKVLKQNDIPEELLKEDVISPPQDEQFENFLDTKRLEVNIVNLLMSYGSREIDLNIWRDLCARAEAIDSKDKYSYKRRSENEEKLPFAKLSEYIIYELENDKIEFSDPVCKKIYLICFEAFKQGVVHDEKFFTHHEDEDIRRQVTEMISSPYELSQKWEKKIGVSVATPDDIRVLSKMAFGSLLSLKTRHLEIKRNIIQKEIKSMQANADFDEIMLMLKREKDINSHYTRLNKILGRIISR